MREKFIVQREFSIVRKKERKRVLLKYSFIRLSFIKLNANYLKIKRRNIEPRVENIKIIVF